jgi:K+-sensing histidine kinase KdpD
MTSHNDARLAILNHMTEWLMLFTNTDDLTEEELDELIEEATDQADLMLRSMSLEVTKIQGSRIAANLQLVDIEPWLEEVLNEKFVEDAEL